MGHGFHSKPGGLREVVCWCSISLGPAGAYQMDSREICGKPQALWGLFCKIWESNSDFFGRRSNTVSRLKYNPRAPFRKSEEPNGAEMQLLMRCCHVVSPTSKKERRNARIFLQSFLQFSHCYIYIYLSIYLSLSIYLYLSLSISIYIYLSLSISIYIYLSLSISSYLYLSLSISIYIYVHLSPSISLHLYLSPSISIYLHLSPSIYLSIYLSIYPSLYLCVYIYTHLYIMVGVTTFFIV